MGENDNTERVLRYLRNEMITDEQSDFEQAYEVDSELQEAYKFHKEVQDGLALKFMHDKKAMLEAIEAGEDPNATTPDQPSGYKSKSKWLYMGGIAATAAAATGLILFLLLPGQSPKALAETHFQPFPDYVTERYRGPDNHAAQKPKATVFKKGMTAYRASSYEKAATLLRQAIDQNQQKALSKLYLANALMASDKPDKAIQHLEGLKDKLNPDYQMQQQWYLALAYVKSGQAEKAKPLLDKLQDHATFQNQQAAQELNDAIE